jgi:hypothetical protein
VLEVLFAKPCVSAVEPNHRVFATSLADVATGDVVPVGIQRIRAASVVQPVQVRAAAGVGIAIMDTVRGPRQQWVGSSSSSSGGGGISGTCIAHGTCQSLC